MNAQVRFKSSESRTVDAAAYYQRGWWGPCPLLEEQGIQEIGALYRAHREQYSQPKELAQLESVEQLTIRPWFKSMHMRIRPYADLALHGELVRRVSSLLGEDFIAWGFTIVERQVGQRHRWHVDVEHMLGTGLTVFLGLEGAGPDASLTVFEGSHKLGKMPQDLGFTTEQQIVDYARQHGIDGRMVTLPISPGSFVLMHGLLWHCSYNASNSKRLAAIIQYSASGTPIRIPTNWNSPVHWIVGTPPHLRIRLGQVVRNGA